MDRSKYPALHTHPEIAYFDASAAFPIHEDVIEAVDHVMKSIVATPSKASYSWSLEASRIAGSARQTAATLLHTTSETIHFCYSASDALRQLITGLASRRKTLYYSPEDHTELIRWAGQRNSKALYYAQNGSVIVPESDEDSEDVCIVLTHIHHLYGAVNDIAAFRKAFPKATIIVDASQSVSRLPIDVATLGCDALLFSAQKAGGIGGVGVCYLAPHLAGTVSPPNSLPLQAIAGLDAAIMVLLAQGLSHIDLSIDRLTNRLLTGLANEVPSIGFSKGVARSDFSCRNVGIVSFKYDGYGSEDIAAILDEHRINVRAGDHCVDRSGVDADAVRVSLHGYNTSEEVDRLVALLKTL